MPKKKKKQDLVTEGLGNGFTITIDQLVENTRVVDIDDVHLWPENPRKNDQNVDNVAGSIKEHGFRAPLIVWTKNNIIYKGNTTWKAAKKLGLKRIPVSFQDFPSEAAATAFGIIDNKSGEGSKWDTEMLAKLMRAPEFSTDLQRTQRMTGLKEKDLNIMLESVEAPEEFPTFKETLDTKHICPKCGYEF